MSRQIRQAQFVTANSASALSFKKKAKAPAPAQTQAVQTNTTTEADSAKVAFFKKKKQKKIQIVEPETKKVNWRHERKKNADNAKTKKETSKEAEGMYETKFPVIDSRIEYTDMNGEVTDCIKLAITHNPTIMSAISNAEIYKTRIGQAWSNYFPTLGAGVSYSRNDMLMTMNRGGAFSGMMNRRYDLYYTPTLSANV